MTNNSKADLDQQLTAGVVAYNPLPVRNRELGLLGAALAGRRR
ncbi:MAG: hypothetical protein ACTHQ3_09410 [Motilibacteraceae bacterium]